MTNVGQLTERTKTTEGEIELLKEASDRKEAGVRWMGMVCCGLEGDQECSELASRPLVKILESMSRSILVPRSDNFTPENRTPWGGTSIVENVKSVLPCGSRSKVVGESWEISGHPSFPNRFTVNYAGNEIEISIGVLATLFPKNMFGHDGIQLKYEGMPFLVKLLNSGGWTQFKPALKDVLLSLDSEAKAKSWRKKLGVDSSLSELLERDYDGIHRAISMLEGLVDADDEAFKRLHDIHQDMLAKNLSVQVHPNEGYEGLKDGEHSKTEAWVIVDAESGAGIYLGLKDGVTKEEFSKCLREGEDVTVFLNFVPVGAGDIFFIPAGTVHAIGAGVMLVEPQETSETTYRVFDYGRVDAKGNLRQLHVDDAMAVIIGDGPRGAKAIASFRREAECISSGGDGRPRVERLLNERLFETYRLVFSKGDEYEGNLGNGIKGFTVMDGAIAASDVKGARTVDISKGQSFIAPAACGDLSIKSDLGESMLLMTTTSSGDHGEV